jgi:hypothetical protein
MRATLQWDSLKTLIKEQYGVPDGILDQVDNLFRLQYKEAYEDGKSDTIESFNDEDED